MKNVALIGASGFVGTAILNELLARGHKVTAVVRNPEKIGVKNADSATSLRALHHRLLSNSLLYIII